VIGQADRRDDAGAGDGARDGDSPERGLADAFARADLEARPSATFRASLRRRFVEGDLAPSAPGDDAPRSAFPRHPRWLAYPAAAAAAAIFLVALAALRPPSPAPIPAPPEEGAVAPVTPEAPEAPVAPARDPGEVACAAAEAGVSRLAALEGVRWRREDRGGRPFLVPDPPPPGSLEDLELVARTLSRAERLLATTLGPCLPAGGAEPVPVTVLCPTREAFESLVAPHMDPVPPAPNMVAFALREERVLVVAPQVIDPDHPPCEELDLAHEAAHQWLHLRAAPGAALPLWLEEGVADGVGEAISAFDSLRWSRTMLLALRDADLHPFPPAAVLGFTSYPEMARHAVAEAPCDERPLAMLPAFHGQASSLVRFLLEEEGEGARRDAFRALLASCLGGAAPAPAAVPAALGFEDAEALFSARDAWMERRTAPR
jgi:hypothetical protein